MEERTHRVINIFRIPRKPMKFARTQNFEKKNWKKLETLRVLKFIQRFFVLFLEYLFQEEDENNSGWFLVYIELPLKVVLRQNCLVDAIVRREGCHNLSARI